MRGNRTTKTEQGTTGTYTYDMTGVHTRKHGNIVTSYLKDYHGNVIGTADSTGRLDYDAYGNQIHGETPDPFGYCGEYQDLCSGLIYLRNRYYDPSIGRFITEDPARDGYNWYVYCSNNPIRYVDPNGLEYIVVSGSENNTIFDRRYKYNFIEPAIKKLEELKSLDDGETITWLISSTAYSKKDINNFKKTEVILV